MNTETEKTTAIKTAIAQVTGLQFEQYTSSSRKQQLFYARMIFVRECHRIGGIDNARIADMLGRDYSTISYCNSKYDTERKYNAHFRRIADSVRGALDELNN